MMREQSIIAVRSLAAFTLLTGVLYPIGITAVAQALFPHQANGSLIVRRGQVVGSELIGQPVSDPKYFWSRLSATTRAFNSAASSGSNLGPLNPALLSAVKDRVKALRQADPSNTQVIPVDLVTASASGLDPHISLAAARCQAPRVARARKLSERRVDELIKQNTSGRWLGLFGEPVVNVLALNLALDEQAAP